MVFLFFTRRGFDSEDSRDLAQNVFLRAYQGLGSFRGWSSPRTWLLTIARHIYLNTIRERSAQKRDIELLSLSDTTDGLVGEAVSLEASPEEQAVQGHMIRHLKKVIDELPPQMAECLQLRLSGSKYREIAEVQQVSIQTVRSQLYRARSRLAEAMRKSSDHPLKNPA